MPLLDSCSADSHCVFLKNFPVCDVDEGRCVGKNGAEQKFIVSIYHLFKGVIYFNYSMLHMNDVFICTKGVYP